MLATRFILAKFLKAETQQQWRTYSRHRAERQIPLIRACVHRCSSIGERSGEARQHKPPRRSD